MQTRPSVPERKVPPSCKGEQEQHSNQITFCPAGQGIAAFLRGRGGKTLLISDGTCHHLLQEAVCSPHVMSIVAEADCLPLFSMPEVTAVIGVGDAQIMIAARFFSGLRRVPCLLVPTIATLEGTCSQRNSLLINGELQSFALARAPAILDTALLSVTRHRALARLLLARLEAVEARACAAFRLPPRRISEVPECGEGDEGLYLANAALSLEGEGACLMHMLQREGEAQPEWSAFFHLSALYAAFFAKGMPRRYCVPDYRRRVTEAGADGVLSVPPPAAYAMRALTLARVRTAMAQQLLPLMDERERGIAQWGAPTIALHLLKYLPEHDPDGLCTVIRDLGLMEWT